jgi:hypothetical protein
MWLSVGITLTLGAGMTAAAGPAEAGAAGRGHCSSGTHTLSHYGDQVYPETATN